MEKAGLIGNFVGKTLFDIQGRITSYNVCYTKLLRKAKRRIQNASSAMEKRAKRLSGSLRIEQDLPAVNPVDIECSYNFV